MDFDPALAESIVLAMVERAAQAHSFVPVDMEGTPLTEATLQLVERIHAKPGLFGRVGAVLQAYLYRTEKDLESLVSMGATVRLVKGAYNEPSEIAYPKKTDVDESYFQLAQRLLSPEARRVGVRAALATHDVKLIAQISQWAAAQAIPKNQIEFAMLYGIQRAEQDRLASEGYRVSVLVSYGSYWFPWFMRRLAERPANILFLAKNIFSG